jgi:predicted transcriptional regulator
MAKEELIYTRISSTLKERLAIEAYNRGEAEAVIVREALNEYFARRESQPARMRDASSSRAAKGAAQVVEAAGANAKQYAEPLPPPGTAQTRTRPLQRKARKK